LFTGGLGAHYGAEALGASVIPISGGNTDRQIMILKDFGVTAICCTPSYFIHLTERARELGVELKNLPLRAGIFGAEPWTEAMRARIEADSNVKAYDIYGLSEIIGRGWPWNVRARQGLTFSRTCSTRRSSIRRRRNRSPTVRKGNWCSPRCASGPCP
jgi:phenylacetate-CoA ligase